ncbi:Cupin domain-containing protein [Chitinophaga costaii]|uniref:Cupin domain-containing protein n=1 Tax=Chitinophaga costaii TaxID=1335309 RepID=A0A1C4BKW8_9BACT|nr:cupin domain-containing protein [Chitinophaga costaii]PUZ27564.1 cupin domain-containing protein [Chitinophaga costaii]SCC07581.1 Cupin domain-containing protein [Chitinophaga costaii]
MATANQTIENKKTGEKITWLETASDTEGKRLVYLFEVNPRGRWPWVHAHEKQMKTLEVSKGFVTVSHGKSASILTAGERIVIPKGVPHQWSNTSHDTPAVMTVTIEPALNTEVFLEQYYGLSNDNKTNENGEPGFFQIMIMINEYKIYTEGPPLLLQKLMGWAFGGLGRLLGYKKYYPQYR